MIKINLYNINTNQSKNLYLEKSIKQDYLSKFFSYDKHKIKKKAFFYFRLLSFKNKEGQNKNTKFSFVEIKNKKNFDCLHKTLINQTQLTKIDFSQLWCKTYFKSPTSIFVAYVSKGVSSHGDNYKVYGKQNWDV